ncbi:MAG: RAMP superfamily CRISPR-associated protein [Chlorobium sp.]
MSLPFPFENGVTGILHVLWTVTLQTPLVIRSGTNASYKNKSAEQEKGRKSNCEFSWIDETSDKENNTEWSTVKDFNFDFKVNNDGNLEARYSIPGSSIRGALRQWTIKNLIPDADKKLFSLPRLEKDVSIDLAEKMKEALIAAEDTGNYWHHILSLFGSAYDLNPGNDTPLTWSGRLQLNTIRLNGTQNQICAGIAPANIDAFAPGNIKRHINIRTPMDRVTMAARSGGLHSGLEMSEGERFTIEFRILNPKPLDLKILKLWRRDINTGFLRFGGLTSQGRGRVFISSENYRFYAAKNTELFFYLQSFGKPDITDGTLFENFWTGVELTSEDLFALDFNTITV